MTAPSPILGKDLAPARLRIAWASPINRRSAIGRCSAEITDELIARGHSVTLISTELNHGEDRPAHSCLAKIVHWTSVTPSIISNNFDIVVLNIGDNYLFHAGIFALFGNHPVVGIFHDFYLYNLFSGWLWFTGKDKPDAWRSAAHDQAVVDVYGAEAAGQAAQARTGQLPLEDIARHLPMTEWLARRCDGALAHSAFYLDRLAKTCPGPLDVAPLPGADRHIPALDVRKRAGRADGRINFLTVGVMNPNKAADQVITAIASSKTLASSADYNLVGPIEAAESERLRGLAKALGFEGLHIVGAADDAALKTHLTHADIICCLRKPVLEGASASAIEALLSGRPTVVADAGFYADLPDDLVVKIPADLDVAILREQLERLGENQRLRREMGEKARAWAAQRFTARNYATRLEPLLYATISAEPLLCLSRHMGKELAQLGLSPDDAAPGRLALALGAILPVD